MGMLQGEKESLREMLEEADSIVFTCALTFFEMGKKSIMRKFTRSQLRKSLEFIRESSVVLDINPELCENAINVALRHNLHAMDALIYRSALENDATLVTLDNDFHGLPGVRVIDLD